MTKTMQRLQTQLRVSMLNLDTWRGDENYRDAILLFMNHGNLAFETGMAGEHRPSFACYCGFTGAPAQPRYFRASPRSLRPSPLQASSCQRRARPAENSRLAADVSQDSAKAAEIRLRAKRRA